MIGVTLRHFSRVRRRIKVLFRDFSWQYESCMDCGHCYRVNVLWEDKTWDLVVGSRRGLLCFECFVIRAQKKNIALIRDDILLLTPFDGKTLIPIDESIIEKSLL